MIQYDVEFPISKQVHDNELYLALDQLKLKVLSYLAFYRKKYYLRTPSSPGDHLVLLAWSPGVQPVAGSVGSSRMERLAFAISAGSLRFHFRDRELVAFCTWPDGIYKKYGKV